MNVLLIVPPYLLSPEKNAPSTRMRSIAALPMGALSVITYNKGAANIRLLDCNTGDDYMAQILWEMQECRPDIVGFTMTFDNSYPNIVNILKIIKDMNPEVIAVVGGAATKPKQTYRTILEELKDVDAVCYSDGEIPFRKLIESDNPRELLQNHPSWITRSSLSVGKPPMPSLVEDLDEVIDLDFSGSESYSFQEESIFVEAREGERQFYVETSRGCPFQCAFCYYSREKDRTVRYASIRRVITRVKELVDNHGMTVLSISDDQFLANMNRAKEIFRQLEQFHIRVEILQGASVGFIDEEMAHLMKKAGMLRVNLPIESGSQYVLDRMVEKPVDLKKAKEVIRILRGHGLWVTANFVMGFPGETDEHRKETLQWIEEAGLDWSTFVGAIPIWGTKLYDTCIENGYIKAGMRLGELDFGNYFIHTPGYTPEYVTRQIYNMNLLCNFVNNYQMKHGDYQTAARVFRKVINTYPNQAFAHYYLAECLHKLGLDGKENRQRFTEIVNSNAKWKEYAEHFNLGG